MSEKQPQNEEKMPAQPAQQPLQAEALVGQAEQHEKALSPEVMEKIMEKVQDIGEYGVAYHGVKDAKDLSKILRVGLMSSISEIDSEDIDFGDEQKLKERAVEFIKKRPRQGGNHFNITGRTLDPKGEGRDSLAWIDVLPEGLPEMAYGFYSGRRPFVIVFDTSSLREVDMDTYIHRETREKRMTRKHRMFHAVSGEFQDRKIMAKQSTGFYTPARIPPRSFRGIAIGHAVRWDEETKNEVLMEKNKAEQERQNKVDSAKKVMREAFQNKPKKFIPIYSVRGDLLWPQKMSYEEVKKFVAEREEKKKENS